MARACDLVRREAMPKLFALHDSAQCVRVPSGEDNRLVARILRAVVSSRAEDGQKHGPGPLAPGAKNDRPTDSG